MSQNDPQTNEFVERLLHFVETTILKEGWEKAETCLGNVVKKKQMLVKIESSLNAAIRQGIGDNVTGMLMEGDVSKKWKKLEDIDKGISEVPLKTFDDLPVEEKLRTHRMAIKVEQMERIRKLIDSKKLDITVLKYRLKEIKLISSERKSIFDAFSEVFQCACNDWTSYENIVYNLLNNFPS